MIIFSFETVLMAFLASNVIVAFAALCFCNKKLLFSMNCKVVSLLLWIVVLRLITPVEFSFASAVELPDSLSQATAYLSDPFITAGSLNISLWRVLGFIWVIGIVFGLIKYIREQMALKHMVDSNGEDVTHKGRYPDTLTRVGIDLLTIIYWWNPVCYLLRGQLNVVAAVSAKLDATASDSPNEGYHMMGGEMKQPLYIVVLAVSIVIFLLSYCFIL